MILQASIWMKSKAIACKTRCRAFPAKNHNFLSPTGSKYKVVLLDFGLKENIKRNLIKRDCDIWVLPCNTSVREIMEIAPDGIMLSNGPGDPVDNPEIIATLRELLLGSVPIFGICLGHQLLALASGFSTTKLKYGHRRRKPAGSKP